MKHGRSPYSSPLFLWNGMAAYFYSSYVTPFHSHNTIQLVFDIQSNFKFRTKNTHWTECHCLIIKENVVHQLDTNNSVQLIVYLDIKTKIAETIKSHYLAESDFASLNISIFQFINSFELQQAVIRQESSTLNNLLNKIINKLLSKVTDWQPDERIRKAEQLISKHRPKLNIKELAENVFLSESRFRSLFKSATGIPIHRYILWNKIRYATNQLIAGYSINEAALDAGFSDSSHFHKMMIKMLGISPSAFLKSSKNNCIQLSGNSPLHFETIVYRNNKTKLIAIS